MSAKIECSVDCQVAPYDHWEVVAVYIDCKQSGDDNHWADLCEKEILQLY